MNNGRARCKRERHAKSSNKDTPATFRNRHLSLKEYQANISGGEGGALGADSGLQHCSAAVTLTRAAENGATLSHPASAQYSMVRHSGPPRHALPGNTG